MTSNHRQHFRKRLSRKNKGIGLIKKANFIPAMAFFASVAISHAFLPSIGKSNLFPLFDWALFNTITGELIRYDLVFATSEEPDKNFYLTHSDLPRDLRVHLFYLAQTAGNDVANDRREPDQFNELKENLKAAGLRPLKLIRIKSTLYDYALAPLDRLNELSENVYEFQ